MSRVQVDIETTDGICPTSVFTPNGTGAWPGVIFYMDGPGIRPLLFEMGERLAAAGYVVMLPDLFYRAGPYAPVNPAEMFADPDKRAAHGKFFTSTSNAKAASDTRAFLDYLDTRSDVEGSHVGVTGYCMGGGMVLAAAATYPDRIAAAASFHGGRLDDRLAEQPASARAVDQGTRAGDRRRSGRRFSAGTGRTVARFACRCEGEPPRRNLARRPPRLDDEGRPDLQPDRRRAALAGTVRPVRRDAALSSRGGL